MELFVSCCLWDLPDDLSCLPCISSKFHVNLPFRITCQIMTHKRGRPPFTFHASLEKEMHHPSKDAHIKTSAKDQVVHEVT